MFQHQSKKTSVYNVLAFLIVLISIFLSGTVFVSLSETSSARGIAYILFYLLSLPFVVKGIMRKQDRTKIGIALLIACVFLMINAINYSSTWFDLLKLILIFISLFSLCIFSKHRGIDLFQYVYYIVLALAIVSLVFFTLLIIARINLPYSELRNYNTFTLYKNYFNIYLTCGTFKVNVFGIDLFRIQSVFWEPGIFGIYLDYALFYYFFLMKKNKKRSHFIVLFLTLILTLSTTGLCVGIAIIAISVFSNVKGANNRVLLAAPIAIAASIPIVYIWLSKATMDVNVNGSYYLRMSDLFVGIRVWLSHFILGTGYMNSDPFVLAQGFGRGSSNGILTWLYTTGFFGMMIILLPFIISFRKHTETETKVKILLFILFIITNMTEPIITTPFMVMIIANQYTNAIGFSGLQKVRKNEH